MIDFSKIEQYRENNRIEAKKALGGLPKSIWETYSAFANTHGGIILLGVEEWADKSLHTVDLPNPDRLIKELRPLGQSFSIERKTPSFFARRQIVHFSVLRNQLHIFNIEV